MPLDVLNSWPGTKEALVSPDRRLAGVMPLHHVALSEASKEEELNDAPAKHCDDQKANCDNCWVKEWTTH